MYESINIKRASTEALIFCKDVSDRKDGKFEPENEIDEKIQACCLHFKNNNYSIQDKSEASFIQKIDGTEENGTIPD
ncbi:hypothetical protein RO3G_07148 [Rhizopus delemar RA 99-880]|uniref:Uncharacterized protein n=1 Tax=Rhizopus delemar (strain RA 99-880 / ATCC MYA-4621 / FGSC 9543 / NRRL 43880) TaxID=246409 RepID=I1C1W3_RHIO9|nr:hypothetical protein RO3G_07148 [Rhizopus delemar RA 99-880]|eukprot:EIE82443.1 hypothetical protein RO3G_07148 [Rhizopus delemar RA 99-880]